MESETRIRSQSDQMIDAHHNHVTSCPSARRPRRHAVAVASFVAFPLLGVSMLVKPPADTPRENLPPVAAQAFWQDIPAAAFKFEMLPISGDESKNIKPIWMSKTEITWEAFDVFVYHLDAHEGESNSADAITRPSKPYLPPDRGFGHEGYAAISMSYKTATEFCKWLSQMSGRHYRLPTIKEWEHACLAGSHDAYCFGDDPSKLSDYAWFDGNANGSPHPVATKLPNAWGLSDMHGNVAEWCDGSDGKFVTLGGSYKDKAENVTATSLSPDDPAWNASDPQIPKSQWWLANAPFVGFRVVCDDPGVKRDGEKTKSPHDTEEVHSGKEKQ